MRKVEVFPAGPGSLEVRWELDEPAEVDISIGTTPVPLEHTRVARAATGTDCALVHGLPPGRRHYVSVVPRGSRDVVVVAERRLPFEGPTNFRDLGGYAVAGGGRTRWGRLFRSDGLHRLTASDLEVFEDLGVQVVYDLRGPVERELYPDPVDSVNVSVLDWYRDESVQKLVKAKTAEDGEQVLFETYVAMVRNSAPLFGQLLGHLAEPGGLPAVFHCAGGKDRTGMAAALLLEAFGAARETVLDDYELTGSWRNAEHEPDLVQSLVVLGMGDEAATAFLSSPRWVMAGALALVDDQFGDVSKYLIGPGKLSTEALWALQGALVE
ncbi:MAG: tyrosine-protein phosphatase [Acidimicrobiales bacterium]